MYDILAKMDALIETELRKRMHQLEQRIEELEKLIRGGFSSSSPVFAKDPQRARLEDIEQRLAALEGRLNDPYRYMRDEKLKERIDIFSNLFSDAFERIKNLEFRIVPGLAENMVDIYKIIGEETEEDALWKKKPPEKPAQE